MPRGVSAALAAAKRLARSERTKRAAKGRVARTGTGNSCQGGWRQRGRWPGAGHLPRTEERPMADFEISDRSRCVVGLAAMAGQSLVSPARRV